MICVCHVCESLNFGGVAQVVVVLDLLQCLQQGVL